MVLPVGVTAATARGEAGDAGVPDAAVPAFVLRFFVAFIGYVVLAFGVPGAASTGQA